MSIESNIRVHQPNPREWRAWCTTCGSHVLQSFSRETVEAAGAAHVCKAKREALTMATTEREQADRDEAAGWLQHLVDDPDGEWGTGAATYDQAFDTAESYMVGGGGPTGWLRFVIRKHDPDDRADEVIVGGWLHMSGWNPGEAVMVPIPERLERMMLIRCRRDAAARIRRGA